MSEELGERVARARAAIVEGAKGAAAEARGAVADTKAKHDDAKADALDILLTQPVDAAYLIVPTAIVFGVLGYFLGAL